MPEVRPATREEGGAETENGERELESGLHDSSLQVWLLMLIIATSSKMRHA